MLQSHLARLTRPGTEVCVWLVVTQERRFGGGNIPDRVGRSDTVGGVPARLGRVGADPLDTIRIDASFERLLAPWVAVPLVATEAAEVDRLDFADSGAAIWHEDGAPVYWDGAERHPLPLDRAELLGPDGAVYGVRGGMVVRWADGVVTEFGSGTRLRGVTEDGRVYFDDRAWAGGTVGPSDLPPGDVVTPDGRVLAAGEDRCRVFEEGEWTEFVAEACAVVAGPPGGWALFRSGIAALVRTPEGWRDDVRLDAPIDVGGSGLVVASVEFWEEERGVTTWETMREPDRWSLAGGAGIRAMAVNDRGEVLTVAEDRETGGRVLLVLRPRD